MYHALTVFTEGIAQGIVPIANMLSTEVHWIFHPPSTEVVGAIIFAVANDVILGPEEPQKVTMSNRNIYIILQSNSIIIFMVGR